MPLSFRTLFLVYSIAIEAVVWIALVPVTWVRALATRDGRVELRQRLGRLSWAPSETAPVLIHAVSVGEMHAAAPLVAEIAAQGHGVLLTTGSAAGLEAGRRLARAQPAVRAVAYLPWDRSAVRGWLARLAPSAVVIVETEIWPNFFRACADLEVPLFVVNGRLRPRDVPRYRLARPFFARILECATWIGVQSTTDRDRFLRIGAPAARVSVAGNLKFDAAVGAGTERRRPVPDASERPLVVAGSTHRPEERWLIDCARLLDAAGCPIRLVLAPRNVARANRVARLARSFGLRVRLESEPAGAAWDVLVLDRYATLRPYYADADLVVVGGTFARVGGHNILEPAACGRPILIGPHTEAIASLADAFADAGALQRVSGPEPARALAAVCRTLLADPVLAHEMGAKAAALCREGAGVAGRYAGVIVERLAADDARIESSPQRPASRAPVRALLADRR